jgi:hypothetical protein
MVGGNYRNEKVNDGLSVSLAALTYDVVLDSLLGGGAVVA